MTFPQIPLPLGDPIDFTDEQLEQMAELYPIDIQSAIVFWHLNADGDLINVIDATPVEGS